MGEVAKGRLDVFAKLIAVILAIGVAGCTLLTLRQQRLQASHELAEIERRVAEHDRMLWRLRVEIAARVTPQKVHQLAGALGKLEPIEIDRWDGADRMEMAAGDGRVVRPVNHVVQPARGGGR
jgi:hypothetical protein